MVRISLVAVVILAAGCDTPKAPDAHEPEAPANVASHASVEPPVEQPVEPAVHGRVRMIDGQRVVNLWGNAEQRGYAHGYLLRTEIIDVVEGYVFEALDPKLFASLAPVYAANAHIDDSLRLEAKAMVAGMRSAGGVEIAGLSRELTAADILLMNAMTDLVAVGCSSVSAWGRATADDPELAGALAVVRNLDWTANEALLRSQTVMVFDPQESDQQPLVSIGFAGYLGCLSCMNEAGVTTLFNMGYGKGAGSRLQAASGFAPANLLLRTAIQARDVDGDGQATAQDIVHTLKSATHIGSYIVHVLEPPQQAAARGAQPAQVAEVEAAGVAFRTPEQGSKLGGEMLAATNHLRVRQTPQPGRRYREIERTASKAGQSVNRDALWTLGERVQISADVVHTLLFVPERGEVRVKLRAPGKAMADSPGPVVYTWDQLIARTN